MSSILIHDLARSEQLDRPTMTAVRGGWKIAIPVHEAASIAGDGPVDATLPQHCVYTDTRR